MISLWPFSKKWGWFHTYGGISQKNDLQASSVLANQDWGILWRPFMTKAQLTWNRNRKSEPQCGVGFFWFPEWGFPFPAHVTNCHSLHLDEKTQNYKFFFGYRMVQGFKVLHQVLRLFSRGNFQRLMFPYYILLKAVCLSDPAKKVDLSHFPLQKGSKPSPIFSGNYWK